MRDMLWNHTSKILKRTSWLGLVVLGVLFLAGATFAEPPAPPYFKQKKHPLGTANSAGKLDSRSEDGKPVIPRSVVNVTIATKTDKRVITSGGGKYDLSKATIVVGEDGKQVDIFDMKVPCDAKITFALVGGVQKALRINVLSTYSDATNQVDYENME